MPIEPYFVDRYRLLSEALAAAAPGQGEQAVRDRMRELARDQSTWTSPDVEMADTAVPGPHGPVPVRTYRPAGGAVGGALLWAHGGGFQDGDLDMPEAHRVSGEIARRAGALVMSVDYRLARAGVRYPVPLDDVHAAWVGLCADRPEPVAIGGASAGAALALGTALRCRDHAERMPDALLLAYPFAHFPVPALDEATAAELGAKAPLARFSPRRSEQLLRNYVGRISDLPPYAVPGAAVLAGLPPTYLTLSEYDDLRPSGALLERQLAELGIPVETHVARGVLHGHLNHMVELPAIEESVDFLATAMQQAMRQASRQIVER